PVKGISLRLVTSSTLEGSIPSGGFCDGPATPTLYFVVRFDRPASGVGSWGDDGIVQDGVSDRTATSAGGLLLRFDPSQVRMKAGLSYVSVDNAAQNLRAENGGWNFLDVAGRARAAWNQVLGRVAGGSGPPRAPRAVLT